MNSMQQMLERRVVTGRANLAAGRDALARKHREKLSTTLSLARAGAGHAEIADIMGLKAEQVRRYAGRHKIEILQPGHCRPFTPKGKPMATPAPAAAASAGAMRAQAQMFRLLDEYFDPAKGSYATDWSDERVAKACALAPKMVREFRKAGFGELKANPEIEAVRRDLAALQKLVSDETAALEARLRKLEMAK